MGSVSDATELGIAGIIDSIRKLHDRFQGNRILRRFEDSSSVDPQLRVRLQDLFEGRFDAVESGQKVDALYQGIEALMSYCRVVRDVVLPAARKTVGSRPAMTGLDAQSRVLLQMTLQALPQNLREYCDRLTDLVVAVRRRDLEIHGEREAVIRRYPGVATGLRELIEWSAA